MTWIGKSHTTQVLVDGRGTFNGLKYEPKCSYYPLDKSPQHDYFSRQID